MEWKSINLSYEPSLTCAGNDNYCKSVHHPIPAREIREDPNNFQNKMVGSDLNWVSRYVLFLAKQKKRGRFFLKGASRGVTLWDYLQEQLVVIRDEKVSPIVKLEIILPLLYFLSNPLTNKHYRTWISMINLWIDSRTHQKQRILLSARQRSSDYWEPSKENVLGEYDAAILNMLYVKVLHDTVSQNS